MIYGSAVDEMKPTQDPQCYHPSLNLTHMCHYTCGVSTAKLRPRLLPCPVCHWAVKSQANKEGFLVIDSMRSSEEKLEPALSGCVPEPGSSQVRTARIRQQSKLFRAKHWPERWSAEVKLCFPKLSWSLSLSFLSTVLMFSDSFKDCGFTRQQSYLLF